MTRVLNQFRVDLINWSGKWTPASGVIIRTTSICIFGLFNFIGAVKVDCMRIYKLTLWYKHINPVQAEGAPSPTGLCFAVLKWCSVRL